MRAVFVDANDTLAAVTEKLLGVAKLPVGINRNPSIKPDDLPGLLGDAEIMIVDHTAVPSAIAGRCAKLKHVVFLGTGACSYINPEELAERGIAVHTIKGYGDTAVAECAIALMWASAKASARWTAACAKATGYGVMPCSSPARRRARRVHRRAATRGARADKAAERDAVGAFGVPHARGERQSDRRSARSLPPHLRHRQVIQ